MGIEEILNGFLEELEDYLKDINLTFKKYQTYPDIHYLENIKGKLIITKI